MEIAAGGNVFIRPNRLDGVGDKTVGHTHNFDHVTVVFTGAIHVVARLPNGNVIERDFHAPAHCLIRADVEHEIKALEPNTVYWCVYAHRTPQGDVVQHETGWTDAYV